MSDETSGDPPASPELQQHVTALIDEWSHERETERIPTDRRWLIRLRGEEKDVITVWLTLGERTLQYETAFMPAPEENAAAVYEYLLRLNARLYGMRFAIGDEDAIYLRGQIPLRAVDVEELDHIIGASYAYTEQYFRAALSLGFASRYSRH
ncbi:MAG: YbjN domain-containing protein [Acidimicrobiales bacterium]